MSVCRTHVTRMPRVTTLWVLSPVRVAMVTPEVDTNAKVCIIIVLFFSLRINIYIAIDYAHHLIVYFLIV